MIIACQHNVDITELSSGTYDVDFFTNTKQLEFDLHFYQNKSNDIEWEICYFNRYQRYTKKCQTTTWHFISAVTWILYLFSYARLTHWKMLKWQVQYLPTAMTGVIKIQILFECDWKSRYETLVRRKDMIQWNLILIVVIKSNAHIRRTIQSTNHRIPVVQWAHWIFFEVIHFLFN